MSLPMQRVRGELEYNFEAMTDGQLESLVKSCKSDLNIYSPVDPAWHGAYSALQETLAIIRQREI